MPAKFNVFDFEAAQASALEAAQASALVSVAAGTQDVSVQQVDWKVVFGLLKRQQTALLNIMKVLLNNIIQVKLLLVKKTMSKLNNI